MAKSEKVLLVSDWHGEIYAEAFFKAFNALGVNAYKFSWKEYFHQYQYMSEKLTGVSKKLTILEKLQSIYYKLQNKYLLGAQVNKINKDLLRKVDVLKPDLIFIYRGTHIFPSTLRNIKRRCDSLIFAYNNDDPFSPKVPFYFYRHFLKGLQYCDHIFAYRYKNIEEYKQLGFSNVSLLMPYYIPENNFNIEKLPTDRYVCDVIFVGHFENDGRDQIIKYLLDHGVNVKIYGFRWEKSKWYRFFIQRMDKIVQLLEDYNLALNSAKIALVFLSKMNNDTYTRRCFEIPAAQTMMLAERTDALKAMFAEDKEAVYFTNAEECLAKVRYYLTGERYKEIAKAGFRRLQADGHSVIDRCRDILATYNQYKNLAGKSAQ